MGYTFDFSVIWENLGVLLAGAWLTIKISLLSLAFGLVIGIIGALFRTAGNRFLDWIALAYVEVIRNTPYLIQLFFIFFGLPNLGIKLTAEQAAILSLAVNFGAYSTEIVRAGVESIPKGQVEAGLAIGFKNLAVFRYIVLPPALANIYTALVGQVILAVPNYRMPRRVKAPKFYLWGLSSRDLAMLASRLEAGRQLYNATLSEALKRLSVMKKSILYAEAKAVPKSPSPQGEHPALEES